MDDKRKPLNERELPDDYPVYAGYFYVIDGEPKRSHLHGVTVAHLKRDTGAKSIQNCDIPGRNMLDQI